MVDDEDELLLDDPIEGEDEADQRPSPDEGEGDETIIEIEGEDAAADPVRETPAIRMLRDRDRQQARRIKELEAQVQPKPVELGEQPKWNDGEGWDWDAEKFAAADREWHGRKAKVDEQQEAQQKTQQVARERFSGAVTDFRASAAKQSIPDFEDAVNTVGAALPEVLGNAIPLYFGDRGPALVKALQQRPDLLEKIVAKASSDPIEALFEMWDMSKGVKVVTKRKGPPEPEKIERGGAPIAKVSSDKKLKELEEKARKTGIRTELIAYKEKLKEKAK